MAARTVRRRDMTARAATAGDADEIVRLAPDMFAGLGHTSRSSTDAGPPAPFALTRSCVRFRPIARERTHTWACSPVDL